MINETQMIHDVESITIIGPHQQKHSGTWVRDIIIRLKDRDSVGIKTLTLFGNSRDSIALEATKCNAERT